MRDMPALWSLENCHLRTCSLPSLCSTCSSLCDDYYIMSKVKGIRQRQSIATRREAKIRSRWQLVSERPKEVRPSTKSCQVKSPNKYIYIQSTPGEIQTALL